MAAFNRVTWVATLITSLIGFAGAVSAETRFEARGSGYVEVTPDQVNFSASVTEVDRDVLKAQASVNGAITAMENAIAKYNLDKKTINSSALSLNPEYQWDADTREQVFIGYRVTRNLVFTGKRTSEIGMIMNSLAQSGATQVSTPQLSYSEPHQAKEQALRNAVTHALGTVKAMASAAGMTVQAVNSISEANGYSEAPFESLMRMEIASAADTAPSVSVGTMRYTAEVGIVATAN